MGTLTALTRLPDDGAALISGACCMLGAGDGAALLPGACCMLRAE